MSELKTLPICLDGESNKDYHSKHEFISSSRLKTIGGDKGSPYAYSQYFNKPKKEDEETTKAKKLGTLEHSMLLEHDSLEQQYYFTEEKLNGTTTAGKEQKNRWLLECKGRDIIPKEMYDVAKIMYDNTLKNEVCSDLLTNGIAEQSLYWKDPVTGLLVKCRPDFRTTFKKLNEQGEKICRIVDIKTADDASPTGFARAIDKYDYLTSAGMYSEGVFEVLGMRTLIFIFIVIQNKWPYSVQPYFLSEQDLEIGRAQYRHYMNKVKECTDKDSWPGYESMVPEERLLRGMIEVQLSPWRKSLIQ